MTQTTRKSPSGPEQTLTPRGYPAANARYVDYRQLSTVAKIPDEDQDGSATFPYDSLQKAADSIEQTSEPSLIWLYPSRVVGDPTAADVDLSAFTRFEIRGMLTTGDSGFSEVRNVTGGGIEQMAFEDLQLESFVGASALVACRGGGTMRNIQCSSLSTFGTASTNLASAFSLHVVDAVVTNTVDGTGAIFNNIACSRINISDCQSQGSPIAMSDGFGPSFAQNCGQLSVDAVVGHSFFVDSWTDNSAPGFLTLSGGVVATVI